MKAIISDKKEIAKGTLLVELELLGERVDFKPGQFFKLELVNPSYTDEKGNARLFSIVNSPNQKDVLVMATRLTDSAFKKSLNELPIGKEAVIENIMGNFTLPNDNKRPLILIAGGIGITPFMSMLNYVTEQKLDYKITLIYSNRDKGSTAFYGELQELANKNKNIKIILTMTQDPEWKGENRRVDAQLIKDYIKDLNSSTFMTAGPPQMVTAVVSALKEAGVDEKSIIIENFGGY